MADYLKLKDTSDFVRDLHSKGIVSTNHDARIAARQKITQTNEIVALRTEINSLHKEVAELKRIVYGIADRNHTD